MWRQELLIEKHNAWIHIFKQKVMHKELSLMPISLWFKPTHLEPEEPHTSSRLSMSICEIYINISSSTETLTLREISS
jgi:hypothetical protein